MPHFQFPTNYVYWTHINDHKHIKSQVLPVIREIEKRDLSNPFTACTMKTSIKEKINFLDIENINKLVWEPIDKMMNEINGIYNFKIKPTNSILKQYWFNTYDVGDFQELHEHLGHSIVVNKKMYSPTFSLIYILHDENKENSTIFHDLNHTIHKPFLKPYADNILDTSTISDIKEGTVIIFSSGLKHLVKPSKISGRTTIAFNVYSCFD